MYILERYILKNYTGPFFFSLSILTFVFVMDFILRYIDPFLKRGIPIDVVLQVFILSLGHMFALIIPMAVLPATLMAFGNLTSENEITAMKANGISLYRMITPGLLAACLLAIGMSLYNNHILPESNHKLRNLLIDVYKKKPSVRIKANTFIDAFENHMIYVREINDKTGEIHDVQIFKNLKKGAQPTTIIAEKGRLKYLETEHALMFELENGEIHEMPEGNDPATYRRTIFKNYTTSIKDIDRSLKRTERKYRGDREMSVKQMKGKIVEIQNDLNQVDEKLVNMAKKQFTEVFQLLDPEKRVEYFESKKKKSPGSRKTPKTGESIKASPPPPSVTLASSSRSMKLPRRGRQEYTTTKALQSQVDIKDSYLKQINRYNVEIQKKFSIPSACVIFVLIGVSIAIRTGRTGMNMAIGLSILFFLIYYVGLIGGEKLADRRLLSPLFAMWGTNVLLGLTGLYLLRKSSQEQTIIHWQRVNPLRLFVKKDDSTYS